MQYSANRILTTHTGSLPRPPSLEESLYAFERGARVEPSTFEPQLCAAVHTIVQQQLRCGLDIINDGEMSKVGYSTYVIGRLSSFRGMEIPPVPLPDLAAFPHYAQRFVASLPFRQMKFPSCDGAITYTGGEPLARDLANLKAAVKSQEGPQEVFMSAASPGIIASFLSNHYYDSYEAYLFALADAMKQEYDTIHQAGILLQLDCPELTNPPAYLGTQVDTSEEAQARLRTLHIEALNHATRDIPADRMRLHVCWGNYEGPHHTDTPLHKFLGALLSARPAGLMFAASNPRHEHEWCVFENVKWPKEKVLVLGVIDPTTNFIEHPELVAQRLLRVANLVGRERVIAGTDCGFSTFAGWCPVDPDIVWMKLGALVEGARRASQQLGMG